MAKELFQEQVRSNEHEPTSTQEILTRGVNTILPDTEGLQKLMEERPIDLYLGVDPTGELHIGHSVPLRKLRQFQDAGHHVTFLFGDFTALIGDPTDKTAARVKQTPEQVANHMKNYLEQVGHILDLSPHAKNPIHIRKNSEWLSDLSLKEILDIQANFSVQQMLERSMFQKRLQEEKPIWLHEFSYPWMQGYDAQVLDVDLEVGGKDQLFNMMVGQTLVRRNNHHEKWVMGLNLIEDPTGKKMGKTEGNIVNLNDLPEVMYEAIMTWPDSSIAIGFELITTIPMEWVDKVKKEILPHALEGKGLHPMDLKQALAFRVVSDLYGNQEATYAEEEFERVKRQQQLPRRIKEVTVEKGTSLIDILIHSSLAKNEQEAQRLLTQQAVLIDGVNIRKNIPWTQNESIIQIGKKTIKNIRRITLT